jgi:hypothetical protein
MRRKAIRSFKRVVPIMHNKPKPIVHTYLDLDRYANLIADDASRMINHAAMNIESATPYKAQYILEKVIDILQSRV